MRLILRWLGNAGFEFQFDDRVVVIDPFLTRLKAHRVYFGRAAPDEAALQRHIPRCDHVLVSHAHFDHCLDAPAIALRTGALVHGSANTCTIMHQADVPLKQTHVIAAGDSFSLGNIQVNVLPAAHPWIPGYARGKLTRTLKFPARLRDYRMDACFSYLLEQVQPRMVIPQHWDDFFQPLSEAPQPFFSAPRMAFPPIARIDLRDFENRVFKARPGCGVLLPVIFKAYAIDFLANSNTDTHRSMLGG